MHVGVKIRGEATSLQASTSKFLAQFCLADQIRVAVKEFNEVMDFVLLYESFLCRWTLFGTKHRVFDETGYVALGPLGATCL